MQTKTIAMIILLASSLGCQKSASPTQKTPPAGGTPAAPPSAASQTSTPQSAPPSAGLQPPAAAQGQPTLPPVKPVPPRLPDIVAKVNNDNITGAELEEAVRELEANFAQPVPIEQRDRVYRQVMDELIGMRLLAQAAAGAGLKISDPEVDAQIAAVRKPYPNEQAFLAAIQQRGLTVDRLRLQVRTQMLISKLIEKDVVPGISVDDTAVAAFYAQNTQQFVEPEAVRASHVLIRVPQNADAPTRAKAKAQAMAVLARAKKGEDFARLAREFSQDAGSAPKGGDLGLVPKGQTPPAFDTAIFTMKPGQVGDLVETPFGYHVVKTGEHRAGRQVPLTEVSERIKQYLAGQQQQQKTSQLVDQLRTKAKVSVLI